MIKFSLTNKLMQNTATYKWGFLVLQFNFPLLLYFEFTVDVSPSLVFSLLLPALRAALYLELTKP